MPTLRLFAILYGGKHKERGLTSTVCANKNLSTFSDKWRNLSGQWKFTFCLFRFNVIINMETVSMDWIVIIYDDSFVHENVLHFMLHFFLEWKLPNKNIKFVR